MDKFISFLKSSKNSLDRSDLKSRRVRLVLGNESCDLDSTVSALLYGYFLFETRSAEGTLVLPILNVSRQKFSLRNENCLVLKEAGIDLSILLFRDNIDLEKLLTLPKDCDVTLVDHHILSKQDQTLFKHVKRIVDHRPIDTTNKWDPMKVQLRIEQVGSCCTLVADEILKKDRSILTKPLAYMLYQTIVFDTIALLPENGKAKDLDLQVCNILEKQFEFTEGRKNLFDRLWRVHNDVSHLSPKQLLYKDLKVVEGVLVPGLPMLVENFLKLVDSYGAVAEFCREHDLFFAVLVGLEANDVVKRDVAIFSEDTEDPMRIRLLKEFERDTTYNFQFEEIPTGFDNICLLRVHNTKLSRKQLVPLIKLAVHDSN
ncbi:exopolyphosphatase PRUNE1 [Cylas formicarius]|uniref:exopolyphosphatase PRUNE1 n=1 Tax=Cylas formicarius TaxID=197179 RepID=UPI002958A8A9|nr:exopolyphosphatase PRUNE1 [Cylas formicarius]